MSALRNFWNWANSMPGEYKQYQEYHKYIDERVAGYAAALRNPFVIPKDPGSLTWQAGFRDGQMEMTLRQKESAAVQEPKREAEREVAWKVTKVTKRDVGAEKEHDRAERSPKQERPVAARQRTVVEHSRNGHER